VVAALYSFFPVRVIDMHFLLLVSWLIYGAATLAIDRQDVSDYWSVSKQVSRIAAYVCFGAIVAIDTHLRDFSMATKYILKRRYEAKKSLLEKDELRSKELLHNMLPPQVLHALEDGEPVEAECYPSVTVIFIQLCDFEVVSQGLQPADLVKILNVIFSKFDDIVKRHAVYKVETVGEVYMAVVGVPTRIQNHAHVAAACALEMTSSIRGLQILIDKAKIKTLDERLFDSSLIKIHIGLNSGPINAGVVGLQSPRYKLFGDTVNTASRMESTCAPGEVQCSAATAAMLQSAFVLEPRLVDVKGKGQMKTAIVLSIIEQNVELLPDTTTTHFRTGKVQRRAPVVASIPTPIFDPAQFIRRIYHYSALRRGVRDDGPPLISNHARTLLMAWLERARLRIQQHPLINQSNLRVDEALYDIIGHSEQHERDPFLGGAKDELVSAVTCCEFDTPMRFLVFVRSLWRQLYFHARRFTYRLVDSDSKYIHQMDEVYGQFIDAHQARWMRGSRMCTIVYMIFICLIEWPYHWILNHEVTMQRKSTDKSSLARTLEPVLPSLQHHMFMVHCFVGPTLCLFAFFTFVSETGYTSSQRVSGTSNSTTLLSTRYNRVIARVFSIALLLQVLYIAEHNNISGGILDDSFVLFYIIWIFHVTIMSLGMRVFLAFFALIGYIMKMGLMRGKISNNLIGNTSFVIVSIVPMVVSRHYSQYTFVQAHLLKNQAKQLSKIAEKSARILRSMLPRQIADNPRLGTALIADHFDQATVLFTDLKGFTEFSTQLTPRQLLDFLNLLFSAFDEILDAYSVYKVEIVGDAYYCVGGCPDRCEPQEHASAVIDAALAMLRILPRICDSHSLGSIEMPQLSMRCGIHTGAVIAAVVDKKSPRYHLFGKTVSYAEKMESTGVPGAVQVSSATYEFVRAVDRFTFKRRSPKENATPTYFVTGVPARRQGKRA
jgi:class 3 adenylate cyclase